MIVFVDVLGLGITLPVMPLYAQDVFGATATQITLLASAYFAAQFLASPRLGRLSDRVGRRPVLILSQAGTFVALLLSGSAFSLPLLYVARIIDGLTGGNISVAQAYLADITDVRNRARGLGLVSAAFGAGFIFGPAFGALVAAYFGPAGPFFMRGGGVRADVTLTWRLLPEFADARAAGGAGGGLGGRDECQPAPGPGAHAGRAGDLLHRLPGAALVLQLPEHLCAVDGGRTVSNRDPQFVQAAVGGFLTFVGVVGIITQFWLVGPLVARFGERVLVAAGTIMRGLAWALIAALPVAWVMLPALLLIAVGGNVAGRR